MLYLHFFFFVQVQKKCSIHRPVMEVTDIDIVEIQQDHDDDDLLNKIKAVKLNTCEFRRKNLEHPIEVQRVPQIMLRHVNFEEYFKPKEMSIGPIHARSRQLFKKNLKLQLAAYFISKSDKSMEEFLFESVKAEMKDIKRCFNKAIIKSYTDGELLRLVFLDGCAMLGFIHSYVNKSLNMFHISNGQAALINQDLFLLENQIPFRVVEVLMGLGREWENENIIDDFCSFLIYMSDITFPMVNTESMVKKLFDHYRCPAHILDLLRDVLLIDPTRSFDYRLYTPALVSNIFERLCSCGCRAFEHINRMTARLNLSQQLPTSWSKLNQSFRTVQELEKAGIMFKASNSLKNISLRSGFFSQLRLPTLVVDNSTACKLLNLVAYEMCLSANDPNNYWITSYVNLLDFLVDSEEDVKDLRAADVLRNNLSTDADAAKLINNIGSICAAPPKDTYENVRKDVEKQYRRRCSIWMAQVFYTHFRNPWTILALFAATTVLVLTAVQTWYAINPKN